VTAVEAPADGRAAQVRAIEASGWGTPFRLVQLRNACFWVFVWAMVAGLVGMFRYYGTGGGSYTTALGTGVAVGGLYTIPWLLLLSYHNRYTALPAKALLVCFLWGLVPAIYLIGLSANTAILTLYNKLFGQAWQKDWGAGLTAPFTEESAKAMAVVLMIGLAPHLVRSAYDGLILGAFAGLGLQVSEDLLYVFNTAHANFGSGQVGTAITVFAQRGGAGLFQHVLFSAVVGAGLVWLIGREPGHRVRGGLLIAGALVVHSCWDNLVTYSTEIVGASAAALGLPVLAILCLLLLWVTFRLAAPTEQQWVRDVLGPEVDAGVLTADEVTAISGFHKARKKFVKASGDRRTAKHVMAAGLDLGQALARSGGRDTDEVRHAREEVARLRLG